MFYVPWCQHCKELMPEWEEFGNKYQGKFRDVIEGGLRIARVDCEEELDICYRFDLDGYPTLMVLNENIAYEFDGELSVEGFLEYIIN